MLADHDFRPGDAVNVTAIHRRGQVLEIDHAMNVARLALSDGEERWALLDDLQPVMPWQMRAGSRR